MKKFIYTLAFVALGIFSTKAQSTEGHIKYDIELEANDEQGQMAAAMMDGSTMEIFFKDENATTKLNMGAIMSMTTIVNAEDEAVLMLMSGMMGKKAIPTTIKELEEMGADEEEADVNVELLDETKDILGYTCKKAIISTEDDQEIVYWYTEDLKMNRQGQKNMNSEIPGVPLEFAILNGPMLMKMTAVEFDEKVKEKNIFSTEIPEGYEKMTMQELQKMGM